MKKILFLTGTRADFGKVKPLINVLEAEPKFEVFVFVTGMHLQYEYGFTLLEIERCNFSNLHTFANHTHETTMDLTLAKTIEGFSAYIKKVEPDLIVVHGDRVETLAGAIVGSLNNILVAHIEGGEISGTIDELIRHSVSKLSHIHFVANSEAAERLEQMGELRDSIFKIGSPDIDVILSGSLPELREVQDYYSIQFEKYAVAIFHPVTTEISRIKSAASNFVDVLIEDGRNFVLIYPNNDLGSSTIMTEYERLHGLSRFRLIPSLRFEYFLVLLKNAQFIIGNSSAGIREAPYFGIPIVNVGSRQKNRARRIEMIHCSYEREELKRALELVEEKNTSPLQVDFGNGNSSEEFLRILEQEEIWKTNHQKQFRDI